MAFAPLQAEASNRRFRLSMLIYDTRYRAITLQVVALILFLLCIGWLTDNVIRNLDAKGKDINFGFLWVRAGYDIEQTLIPYTNDSSHGRAVIIGLLNTLVIAILGCVLATVLGVVVGVLRLSKNWLIARITTAYVETFRNIPLLLWILLVFVVISETMPAPNDFKITPAILEARAAAEAAGETTSSTRSISLDHLFSFSSLLWLISFAGISLASVQFARNHFVRGSTLSKAVTFAPMLLWAALGFFALKAAPPAPIDAGGAATEPAASMMLFDTVALTNRGTNIPSPYFERALGGTEIAGLPVNYSLILVLAVIAASLYGNARLRARANAVQEATGQRPATFLASLATLLLPISALCFVLGLHWDVPHFPTNEAGASQGFNFKGGIQVMHSFTALLIALSFYTSAFIAEIVRAGIMAIPKGQAEAAAALGLRPGRTMKLVILPQALRVIIPPLISQFLNLTKNTSLGIAVSYLDLRGTLGGITLNQTGRELEAMLLMMLIYLTISLIVSGAMNAFNASVKLKER